MSNELAAEDQAVLLTRLRDARVNVFRHDYDGNPEFLCFGTVIGEGVVATVADRGILLTREGKRIPPREAAVRIFVQFEGDPHRYPVDWMSDVLDPIVLLHVRDDAVEIGHITSPLRTMEAIAALGEIVADEYAPVWRLANSRSVFADNYFSLDATPEIVQGTVFSKPRRAWFRNGAHPQHEATAFCCHAGLEYPGRYDLGGPLSVESGETVGVLIGADLGPEASHQGAFMPVAMIHPFAQMCLAEHRTADPRERWRLGGRQLCQPVVQDD